MNGTGPEVTPKKSQSLLITLRSGRLTLFCRNRINVGWLIPVATATSLSVIFLPSSNSCCFQTFIRFIFTAIILQTRSKICLTKSKMYVIITYARLLSNKTIESSAIIFPRIFGKSKSPDKLTQQPGSVEKCRGFCFPKNIQGGKCLHHLTAPNHSQADGGLN